jgi:tyrosinase
MARITLLGLLKAVPWLLLAPDLVSGDAVKDLQDRGRPNLDAAIARSSTCTKEKLQVRREWYVSCPPPNVEVIMDERDRLLMQTRGDISAEEKKAYIAAVKCLLQKPSRLDPVQFPGAKSRYDDFVVVHMNQTLTIHGTVSLSRNRCWLWPVS